MAGTIGRTLAGKALDEHILIYKDRTLKHKIFRCVAQLDRAFLGTLDDAWERGNIYARAASVIRAKFPQKRLALLRKHLYAYAESLFKKKYEPELAYARIRANQSRLDAERAQYEQRLKVERDQKLFELGFMVTFPVFSYLLLAIALRP